MAEQSENTKSRIIGLLEVRKHRGLVGDASITAWMVNSLEVLLMAELERIEKRETDNG